MVDRRLGKRRVFFSFRSHQLDLDDPSVIPVPGTSQHLDEPNWNAAAVEGLVGGGGAALALVPPSWIPRLVYASIWMLVKLGAVESVHLGSANSALTCGYQIVVEAVDEVGTYWRETIEEKGQEFKQVQ